MKKTHFNPRYILVYPSSAKDYEARLMKRKNMGFTSSSTLQLLKDRNEQYDLYAKQAGFFDAVIINDDFDEAYNNFIELVKDDIRAMREKNQTKSRPMSRSRTKILMKNKSRPTSVKEQEVKEGVPA